MRRNALRASALRGYVRYQKERERRTTYSLDLKTVGKLEQMARRWNVSKSEALRQVIRAAAKAGVPGEGREAIRALDDLQRTLDLDSEEAVRREKAPGWSAKPRRGGGRKDLNDSSRHPLSHRGAGARVTSGSQASGLAASG